MSERLVDRLLRDAESRAARRGPSEALLLLRWAGAIAPRSMIPRVLLAFHRVRALHPMSDQSAGAPPSDSLVDSDHLGFPVPRFAIRPPELDRSAFVPAPRFTPEQRTERGGGAGTHHRHRARGGPRILVRVAVAALLATIGASLAGVRPTSGGAAATKAAAVALRLGNPRQAVVLLNRLPDPDPRALLVRGQALLALADTPAAALSFQKAAVHPRASGDDALSSARELSRLTCCAAAAADAYLRAFARGTADHRVPEIARHLERAGRSDQAMRIREFGSR